MGIKKMLLGGALIVGGSFTMFEYLIMDSTIYAELDDVDSAFIAYITMYGKNYVTLQEYQKRKGYFQNSIFLVGNQSLSNQSFIMGLNEMSDWSTEEYYKTLGMLPEGKYPVEIVDGDFEEEDQDDEYWKGNFDNKEWSSINPNIRNQQQSLWWFGGDNKEQVSTFDDIFGDPDTLQQMEIDLESAFKNGTIIEDDTPQTIPEFKQGQVQLQVIKPEYKEKYEGLLTEFSWLDSTPKVVSRVKKQGSTCAASYAFSVIAALESAYAIENVSQPKKLSEQQVIECTFDGSYTNFGCLGGGFSQTWKYAKENAILESKLYPYTGKQGLCKDTRTIQNQLNRTNSFVLSDFKQIESNSPSALRKALEDGPVAATVRAGSRVFRDYANGIIDSTACNSAFPEHQYDHGVLIIGYGKTILGGHYFLVKNSFGKNWGNQGYAMISANNIDEAEGTCGILANLYQAEVKANDVKYLLQQSIV